MVDSQTLFDFTLSPPLPVHGLTMVFQAPGGGQQEGEASTHWFSHACWPKGVGGYRSEGLTPNGIFGPWAWWSRALARWESCRRVVVVVVGVTWKFRSTFRPGNYIWSFSYGFGVVVKDIWEWRPGFYSEFRYKSYEHSGLAYGAILKKVLVLTLIPRLPCSFFQEHVPKIIQGSTTQPLEPPARLRPPAARISRALGIMETSISNISRIWEIRENQFSNISRMWENSKKN